MKAVKYNYASRKTLHKVKYPKHIFCNSLCAWRMCSSVSVSCMNMFCTVMAYICCCQWEVIVVMPRLVICSETLAEKGLCGLRVGLYHFSCTAAIKSSHTQTKLYNQASRASVTLSQPEENSRRLP